MNELLWEKIVQKELENYYLKPEIDCVVQGIAEAYIDADTQTKFNNSSTILYEILSFQMSPEENIRIGYTKEGSDVYDKGGHGSNQHVTFKKKYEQLTRHKNPMYINSFRCKNSFSSVKFWRCNHIGHIAKCCHTIRFYMCDEYGKTIHNVPWKKNSEKDLSGTSLWKNICHISRGLVCTRKHGWTMCLRNTRRCKHQHQISTNCAQNDMGEEIISGVRRIHQQWQHNLRSKQLLPSLLT